MSFKTYVYLFNCFLPSVATWDGKDEHGLKLFQVLMLSLQKFLPKLIMVCAPRGNFFDIFILNSTGAFYVWLKPGGHLGIFWVGMCCPGLQIGTPFFRNGPVFYTPF